MSNGIIRANISAKDLNSVHKALDTNEHVRITQKTHQAALAEIRQAVYDLPEEGMGVVSMHATSWYAALFGVYRKEHAQDPVSAKNLYLIGKAIKEQIAEDLERELRVEVNLSPAVRQTLAKMVQLDLGEGRDWPPEWKSALAKDGNEPIETSLLTLIDIRDLTDSIASRARDNRLPKGVDFPWPATREVASELWNERQRCAKEFDSALEMQRSL